MTDYCTPTVMQQTIPDADMTPLERLLLSHIFTAEPDGDGWYFYSEEGPVDMLTLDRAEVEAALAASQIASDSVANTFVTERLTLAGTGEPLLPQIDLDLSTTSWEFIVQDIVRRSPTLGYVSAVSSFTCSKMRRDGFGGMAALITADAVKSKSTNDIIEDFFDETRVAALRAQSHVLLWLDETAVRREIAHVIEADETLTALTAEVVTDADIHAACCAVAKRTDLSEERDSALFRAALAAIREAERRHAHSI